MGQGVAVSILCDSILWLPYGPLSIFTEVLGKSLKLNGGLDEPSVCFHQLRVGSGEALVEEVGRLPLPGFSRSVGVPEGEAGYSLFGVPERAWIIGMFSDQSLKGFKGLFREVIEKGNGGDLFQGHA